MTNERFEQILLNLKTIYMASPKEVEWRLEGERLIVISSVDLVFNVEEIPENIRFEGTINLWLTRVKTIPPGCEFFVKHVQFGKVPISNIGKGVKFGDNTNCFFENGFPGIYKIRNGRVMNCMIKQLKDD
jgi:hypothetical protein